MSLEKKRNVEEKCQTNDHTITKFNETSLKMTAKITKYNSYKK